MIKNVTLVFWYSIAICGLFVLWGSISPDHLKAITESVKGKISAWFGWYYLLAVVLMVVFCIYLIFSRFNKIKLGKKDEQPAYSLPTWFAMLFSAGMGMGMVFWTTAEPIKHAFTNSPSAQEGTPEAIKESLQYSFFHWGIHGWAVYSLVALVLAYFKFHKGYPGLISATLIPLFGQERMEGKPGKLIDTLAVVATVTGIAATLGFGTAQINEGLKYLFNIPSNYGVQLVILLISTVLFILSAWSGISKGIKYLSNINMVLGILLLILLFVVGPTLYMLNMFTNSFGGYITNFFSMSFHIAPIQEEKRTWIENWTIFYWAWWIAWSPFVGSFIARISRGRTIKEFMLGVLFVPSIICFIFFAVFGTAALDIQQKGIETISQYPLETTTFAVLQHYPIGEIMSFLTIIVIAIFFITSADSATFVLGMMSSAGAHNPTGIVKVVWGVCLSAIAAVIMYFGGTQGLQNVLVIAGLPFSIIVFMMGFSFYRAVSQKVVYHKKKRRKRAIGDIQQNESI